MGHNELKLKIIVVANPETSSWGTIASFDRVSEKKLVFLIAKINDRAGK